MIFKNPVIRGFNPDPSVCKADGKYFLAASSFQFFPGVPLFESDDLVNWRQIGYCLTRKSQLPLDNVGSSGGIYAPTIRYNEGRFYMVTTNVGHKRGGNFYVWTDDIYGEWSEPVFVDQGGIDPSLYFENGKTYFMSNGTDENGKSAILQCEIDIATGKKLTGSKPLWHGTGGRYLEAPHIYKIGKYYYLMAAEGGTEYGHMIVYARGDNLWGPFTPYPGNPVLTNRNLGGYELQGIGHGDLLEDANGAWWMYALGFRQIDKWMTYHHLGRETCLMPVTFNKDGWFTSGDGTASVNVETDRISPDVKQNLKTSYAFKNTKWYIDWRFLREYKKENYILGSDSLKIKSSTDTLDTPTGGSPAFIALHQKESNMELSFKVKTLDGEAGISVYMDENHHYDLALSKTGETYKVILKLNIGDIKHEKAVVPVAHNEARLMIRSNAMNYSFISIEDGRETILGSAQTRYLSSEVAGGFTGVVLGLYSQFGADGFNEFTEFECAYRNNKH
ncbi:MAG: glycoside hydrolase family 43 protein [Treponema sp.]|jgi:alpha-N-arabinofuranosidase|nr:glycoside hydrolase family 43 protein [Treponema sp.]